MVGWLSRYIFSSTALEAMQDALAVEHKENQFLLALRKLATEHRDVQVLAVITGTTWLASFPGHPHLQF